MKPYMFRTLRLSIIRSLFTVHSAMVYVIQVCRQLSDSSCPKAVYKPVLHKTLLSVRWMNSWWCTEELSETCRVSCQNKFVKLVHLVGFIIKKFVTMYGHTNVKFVHYAFQQQTVVFSNGMNNLCWRVGYMSRGLLCNTTTALARAALMRAMTNLSHESR
jgi:hypothetical protein